MMSMMTAMNDIRRLSLLLVPAFFHLTPGAPAIAQEASSFSKSNLDLPFDAGPQNKEEEEEECPEIVVFYGQEYEGDGIFFCCDKSGTMKEGSKWRRLQMEVVKNISQFSERVQFGIVFFDSSLVMFPSSGKPADVTLKAEAKAMVMATQPGSGTCTKPALLQSLNFARQSTARRKLIIHLSDGIQTCPGFDPVAYGQECLDEVTTRNAGQVQINTICIGQSVDEDWMWKLAVRNRGQMVRIRA